MKIVYTPKDIDKPTVKVSRAINYAITKQELTFIDKVKFRLLMFILPRQIIIDYDLDRFRSKCAKVK